MSRGALFQVTFAPGMTIMLKDAPVTELYVINSGVVEMVLASTHEARGAQALDTLGLRPRLFRAVALSDAVVRMMRPVGLAMRCRRFEAR